MNAMEYKTIDELLEKAKAEKKTKRLAVAAAADEHVIEAVCRAESEGIVESWLVGNREKICGILKKLGKSIDDERIIDAPDVDEAARIAVKLVVDGKADFLMKGLLNTSNMLKAVLNRECGLRTGSTLSHISINESANYKKLFVVTDAGINIAPDVETKRDIINNAVKALRSMGYDNVNVAVLAALEKVNPKIQSTVDAAELKEMNQRGKITDCVVEGPISMDLAMDEEAAKIKGFDSPVVGNADVFVVPDLNCGNILNKGLRFFGKNKQVGIVVGAKVPIALTSRGATAESKYLSIVVTSAMV